MTKRKPNLMDETAQLTGFRGDAFTTTRGTIYAAAMEAGHSEFAAMCFARNAIAADNAKLTMAQVVAAFNGAMPAEILAA